MKSEVKIQLFPGQMKSILICQLFKEMIFFAIKKFVYLLICHLLLHETIFHHWAIAIELNRNTRNKCVIGGECAIHSSI